MIYGAFEYIIAIYYELLKQGYCTGTRGGGSEQSAAHLQAAGQRQNQD